MPPRRCARALTAVLVLGTLTAACSSGVTSTTTTTTTTLCHTQVLPVSGGAYQIQNNEWGSRAPECITTDGNADFRVAHSSIANSTDGAPGGYPFIYKGCHWGACTSGSGLPIQVSSLRAGTVTTSWMTTQPGGSSIYNAAYDIWFNQAPATSGQPDGAELMIWLALHGPNHPGGVVVASGVVIGGLSYDVWQIRRATWNAITYVLTTPATSVHLDLQPLVADAVRRGALRTSWYLISVEAGFEVWQGGTGLATNMFAVHVAAGG